MGQKTISGYTQKAKRQKEKAKSLLEQRFVYILTVEVQLVAVYRGKNQLLYVPCFQSCWNKCINIFTKLYLFSKEDRGGEEHTAPNFWGRFHICRAWPGNPGWLSYQLRGPGRRVNFWICATSIVRVDGVTNQKEVGKDQTRSRRVYGHHDTFG